MEIRKDRKCLEIEGKEIEVDENCLLKNCLHFSRIFEVKFHYKYLHFCFEQIQRYIPKIRQSLFYIKISEWFWKS